MPPVELRNMKPVSLPAPAPMPVTGMPNVGAQPNMLPPSIGTGQPGALPTQAAPPAQTNYANMLSTGSPSVQTPLPQITGGQIPLPGGQPGALPAQANPGAQANFASMLSRMTAQPGPALPGLGPGQPQVNPGMPQAAGASNNPVIQSLLASLGQRQNQGRLGRNGDTQMAHVTPGEMVLPKSLMQGNPDLMKMIQQAFQGRKDSPGRYVVGGRGGSINPLTGRQEFYSSDDAAADAAAEGVGGGTGVGGVDSGSEGVGGDEGGVSSQAMAAANAAATAAAAAQAAEDAFGGMHADPGVAADIGNFGIEFSPISPSPDPHGIGIGTAQQARASLEDMSPTQQALESRGLNAMISLFSPVSPDIAKGVAKGLGSIAEALGIPGTTESADAAVAGQEATAADAGAGDAGEQFLDLLQYAKNQGSAGGNGAAAAGPLGLLNFGGYLNPKNTISPSFQSILSEQDRRGHQNLQDDQLRQALLAALGSQAA